MPRGTSTGTTSFSANTNKDHEQDRKELQELKWQRLEHYSAQYPIPKGHAGVVNTGYREVPVLPIKQRDVVIENLWSYAPFLQQSVQLQIVLSIRLLCSFPTTVCDTVRNIVRQVAVLPSYNSKATVSL